MLTGEKINHFEANTNETVKEFNELFGKQLVFPEDSIVTILEPLIGSMRALEIEGKSIQVNLDKEPKKQYYKPYTMRKQKYGR